MPVGETARWEARHSRAETRRMSIVTNAQATIAPSLYREVMGNYPTGVVVVTAVNPEADGPIGMVVGTFSAVSMDPPLVSFLPQRTSGTYARLAAAQSYCVNVVAADQVDLCKVMAARDPDKFGLVDWTTSEHGAPQLADAVAYVHCRPVQQVEAGDHYFVLCAVDAMEVNRPVAPLLFFRGGYGEFASVDERKSGGRVVDDAMRAQGWFYFRDFPM